MRKSETTQSFWLNVLGVCQRQISTLVYERYMQKLCPRCIPHYEWRTLLRNWRNQSFIVFINRYLCLREDTFCCNVCCLCKDFGFTILIVDRVVVFLCLHEDSRKSRYN